MTCVFRAMLGIGVETVFSVTHVDDTGLVVGMLVVFPLADALIGLSISSTAFSSVFGKTVAAMGLLPEQLSTLQDASRAIGFIPVLRTLYLSADEMSEVLHAYTKAFQVVWIILATFLQWAFLRHCL